MSTLYTRWRQNIYPAGKARLVGAGFTIIVALGACSVGSKDEELTVQMEQPVDQLYNDALKWRNFSQVCGSLSGNTVCSNKKAYYQCDIITLPHFHNFLAFN